ncbi:UNVERIFIED_CONTAM: hypothetical protein Sradi_3978100 [Sesamum radiatum]|uniref:DDE Tnp4 domain-containing protein n=1 Tax=Sesamum radiatum TaxID=300843 RepID=A0AAW2PHE3_SESRA
MFLAPYRGTRYHLPEWRGQGRRYRTPEDMFNYAHSRLRNVIERCFSVLKKRFPILQWGMPSFLLNHQVDLVIACCTLHNFIRKFSNDDLIFNEPEEDTPADMETFYHRGHPTTSELEAQHTLRDSIAMQIHGISQISGECWISQEEHWTLNVEQRFMWMIVDDNTRAPMRDDARAETQMGHWARGLRRYFGYPYTRDQNLPLARRYYQYPEPHYPSMQETHIASWDAVGHVAHGDVGPRMARSHSLAARCSLDMGSKVGGLDHGQTTFVTLACSLIGVHQLIVTETAQRAHADHRDSHYGGVTVLRRTVPIVEIPIELLF